MFLFNKSSRGRYFNSGNFLRALMGHGLFWCGLVYYGDITSLFKGINGVLATNIVLGFMMILRTLVKEIVSHGLFQLCLEQG